MPKVQGKDLEQKDLETATDIAMQKAALTTLTTPQVQNNPV
jgi:hypothetical protein